MTFPPGRTTRSRQSAFWPVASVIALGLAATGAIFFLTYEKPSAADIEIATAKADLRQRAKDADSVEFRNMRSARSGVVCGEFNGRNSFGAMAGYSRFVWTLGLVEIEGDATFPESWRMNC